MAGVVAGGAPAGTVKASIAAPPGRRGYVSFGLNTAYQAGSHGSQELSGWHPRLRSSDAEILPSRDKVVARSRDLDRNNPWINGAVTKKADAIVGSNIRLKAKPDFLAMGQTAEWADEWAMKVEALWRTWANDPRFLCDVERHLTFGGLVRLAYIHWLLDGEACAVINMRDRGGPFETCVLVLDPDRLSNPVGKSDADKDEFGNELRGGVAADPETGAAVGYWVRRSHPGDVGNTFEGQKHTFVPRENERGRPIFIHAVNKRRAHQHRSLGVLTPSMGRMKNLDTYDRYEIQAAMRNQAYGMYIESPFDSEFVRQAIAPAGDENENGVEILSDYQALRLAFHEATDVSMAGVPLANLVPGEKVVTVAPTNPTTNFTAFTDFQLGAVSSPFGLASEQMTGRWAGVNYSNARMIKNEANRGWTSERFSFCTAFCSPVYATALEEFVARDMIDVPGGQAMFYVHYAALTRCEWLGPPSGSIDKLKEGKGDQIDRDGFVGTLEAHCAERGLDWREVLWQRKREQEALIGYGLVPDPAAAPDPAAGGENGAAGGADNGATGRQPTGALALEYDPSGDPWGDNDVADAREARGEDA
ncbi:MAG: hypothetical protein QOH47_2405 [Sphingomonadales bacterium]|jgi:lambda family phage portal protein|nr:hypothetical protein [Sphingomonadales bacterium]